MAVESLVVGLSVADAYRLAHEPGYQPANRLPQGPLHYVA